MAIKAEVAATVVEDDQQAGSAQPVGEYHASAVHRADGAAGARRNQYAVPFRLRIVAALLPKRATTRPFTGHGSLPRAEPNAPP